MHKLGGYKPEDLQTEKPYKALIDQTYKAFNAAIIAHEMPDTMRKALQNDALLFGGLKANTQLFEASKLLLDEKGNLKPFSKLNEEFDKLNIQYNRNYLEAEYEFAASSSQMAAKWEEFSDSDRYNLQYRTAGDNRVRDEHAALRDITLPKTDKFWSEFMPPNGWNCRCTVVEVLKDKFPESESDKAVKAGEAATYQEGKNGKNRLELFRFNPGAEKKVFPPAHPYRKVKGAKEVKEQIEKPKVAKKEVKKETEYQQVSPDQFKKLYESQDINKSNEKAIMGGENGYVATGNSFNLNEKLRYGYNIEGEDKITIDALDSLIGKNTLKNNTILYRNVDDAFVTNNFDINIWGKSPKEIIERMNNSEIKQFSDNAFCSTSAIEKKNVFQQRQFQIKIKAKEGTNAFVTNNVSESEVILGRNQKFKIVEISEIKGERIRITVETD